VAKTRWIISVTRDVAEHAEAVIEAKSAAEARRIFASRVDDSTLVWREGDHIGGAEVVEVLPVAAFPNGDSLPLTELE
jgi:hypothetical protein